MAISDTVTTLTYTVVISDVYGRHAPYLESSQFQRLKLGQSYTVTVANTGATDALDVTAKLLADLDAALSATADVFP